MCGPTVQSVSAFYASPNGLYDALDFWDHAAADYAVHNQAGDIGDLDDRKKSGFVLGVAHQAHPIGQDNQLLGTQSGGKPRCCRIGIYIVGNVGIYALSHSRHNRDTAAGQDIKDRGWFDIYDITHISVINTVILLPFCVQLPTIQTAEADGLSSGTVDLINKIFVDFPA